MEKDERFAHVATDPRFRRMPKAQRKVRIDRRFQSMFVDNRFSVKYTLDKRGRPANYSSGENLKKFYECSSSSEDDSGSEEEGEESDEESESEEGTKESDDGSGSEEEAKESDEENELSEEEEEKEANYLKKGSIERSGKARKKKLQTESKDDIKESRKSKSKSCKNKKHKVIQNKVKKESEKEAMHLQSADVDYARGGGAMLSDSSSEEESEEEEELIHNWGELNKTDETVEEPTSRLALCNLIWDRIKAKHIMMFLSSFILPGGSIKSVTIYPSEFGLKRMAEEDQLGPKELVQEKVDIVDSDGEIANENDNLGSYFDMEKLREYQIKRLQYYYAVVVCDSAATASHLYDECDGMEFESTSNHLDLRFIPEDMEFDQEPHDTCTTMTSANELQKDFFCSQALQYKNVALTWDETDPERLHLQKKLFSSAGGVDENELKIYLGSGSSSEDDENEEKKKKVSVNGADTEDGKSEGDSISKYRNLLLGIQEEKKKEEEKDIQMEVKWELGLEEKTKELMKKIEQKDNKSPWEIFLEKKKEKRMQKLQDRKQKENGQENESDDDYTPAGVNWNDSYFQEEFDDSEFPSTENEKKTKKSWIKKKGKKQEEEESEESRRAKAELELLTMDEYSNKNHFSLKSILAKEKREGKTKAKNKMQPEANLKQKNNDKFQLNVGDPRFDAIYTSHHYHIDPTHSHFKKTKGSQAFIEEKQRRKKITSTEPPPKKSRQEIKQKDEQDLSLLVKSVKNKTANFLNTRKKKL